MNNRKAYAHHPYARKFLIHREDGLFELYDPKQHGENVWAPTEEDSVGVEEEYYEASISLERDLEKHLAKKLTSLEPGLKLV